MIDRTDLRVASSAIHGTGVFAFREFAAGELVFVIDDSRIVDLPVEAQRECLPQLSPWFIAEHADRIAIRGRPGAR